MDRAQRRSVRSGDAVVMNSHVPGLLVSHESPLVHAIDREVRCRGVPGPDLDRPSCPLNVRTFPEPYTRPALPVTSETFPSTQTLSQARPPLTETATVMPLKSTTTLRVSDVGLALVAGRGHRDRPAARREFERRGVRAILGDLRRSRAAGAFGGAGVGAVDPVEVAGGPW